MSASHTSEHNPIPDGYHELVTDQISGYADWTTPGLRIVRCRFLSDPGVPFWDLTYCHGQLPNGDYVDVGLPFAQLEKWTDGSHTHRNRINRQIVEFAIRDGIFAKGTGILDAISTFN